MGPETNNSLQSRAIEWHVRLRDGDDATWEAFVEWLAQDPRHGQAYDAIEQIDLAIEPLLPGLALPQARHDAANAAGRPGVTRRSRFRRWGFAGGALAASVAAAIVLLPFFTSSRYEVATGPGQRRTVTLDGTTQVTLNGSTRISFDRRNPRFAALAAGEALFRVNHDAARPFTLEVGDKRVEDVGTVFNVVRDPGEVRVAVADGKIVYRSGNNAVPLDAGQALVDRAATGTLRVTRAAAGSAGAWEGGHLVYSGEPLSQVADDLGRSLGIRIAVSASIADRPFSGSIALDGTDPAQRARLKLALNVAIDAGADGWTMKPLDEGGAKTVK